MKEKVRFLADIIIVFLCALLQSSALITIYGVKPNFLISALVVLLFSARNFWQYLILVLTAAVSLKYSALLSKEILIFAGIMILAYFLKKYLVEYEFIAIFILTAFITIIFYLLIDYRFAFNNPNSLLLETAYNIFASAVLLLLYEKK